MITDPRFAPRRADLTFLRRRKRPKEQPAQPAHAASTATAQSSAPKIDYSRPDRAPSTPAPAAGSGVSDSLDLSRPSESPPSTSGSKIDYSRPARRSTQPPPAQPAQPAAGSDSLDLSTPSAPPSAPSGGIDYSHRGGGSSASSDSLDLSDPPAASAPPPSPSGALDLSDAPAPAASASPPQRRPTQRVHLDVHVRGRGQQLLSIKQPTVTLTRMQSGIGELSIEAVCSPEVGDLRLGAVYQLRSGGSLTVQHADGHRFGPPKSRRPVIVATREEYERISLDLRQIRDMERIGIYAYSQSRSELTWNGTLVITTFGGAQIELPLETLYAGRIAMLISLYNLDGELVIRAEMETIAGDVREAARAYGYDRITWRDDRAPVD